MAMRPVVVSSVMFVLAACAAPRGGESGAGAGMSTGASENQAKTSAAEESADKVADLERQVDLARRKLERADMDLEQQARDGAAAVEKAQQELAAAQRALVHFDQFERPQRLAQTDLQLVQVQDNLTEQQEEMQQLELMYEKDDLADKTKEIVLARGRRRVQRAEESLELQKGARKDLEEFVLAEQRRKLELELRAKEVALQGAEFAARTGHTDKEIARDAQQNELAKLTGQLEKAREGAAAGGGTSSSRRP